MSRQRGASERINLADTSDVVTVVRQVDRQIVFLLKVSPSLWQSQGKRVRWSRMFIAAAFQQGVLSERSLYLDPSEVAYLRRRPAWHLFKCVCNLETFLGKQARSEESYLHAKAEESEE